jgi:hypothetical protein
MGAGCGMKTTSRKRDLIAEIVGFPDPWLFEQCGGLPPDLT